MTAIFFAILSYLLLYKYVALFIVCYLAAFLLPLPSNTSLLAASAFASQGFLNIYLIIFVALLANVLGDITGFVLARKYGKDFLMKIGFRKMIESKRYSSLEKFIVRHSKITIFVTRFFGGIGPLVNILTGLSEAISTKKFLTFGIAGETVYVLSFSLSGYFLGNAWEELTPGLTFVTYGILAIGILFVISKIYFRNKDVVIIV